MICKKKQQLEKLNSLESEVSGQNLILDKQYIQEQALIFQKESLTLELNDLTAESLINSIKVLSLEDKKCATSIEQLSIELAQLLEGNETYQETLKKAGKVYHSHKKQYEKR